MSGGVKSSMSDRVEADRVRAREEVLLRLLAGEASVAKLRHDLTTRCGGATAVVRAREWLARFGYVTTAPVHKPVALTQAGIVEAQRVRAERDAKRAGRAA